MFENRVVAQTVSELRGRYNPGSTPRVELAQRFDSNSVFAHEDAHRTLSEGTTLGFYLVALAIAAERSSSEQTRQLASAALTEVEEQCWFVEEGFATWNQQLYIESTNGDVASFEASLLPSYRSARNKFQFHDREQLKRLIRLSRPAVNSDELQVASLLFHAMKFASLVLAGAAMSIPLASFLNGSDSLPNVQIMSHIRRNSPDLRLERLVGQMDAYFAYKCLAMMFSVADLSHPKKLFKRVDQSLDILITELAAKSEIETEPLWSSLQVLTIFEKLGVGRNSYHFRDIQELSINEAESHFSTVTFDAAEELVQFPPLPIEDAQRGYAELVVPRDGEYVHIVCELVSRFLPDSLITVFIHVYTFDRTDAPEQVVTPRLASLIHTASAPDQVSFLPDRFPCQSWNWLLGDFDLEQWDTGKLGRFGKTFAVRMHLRGSAPRPHAQEFLIPANPLAVVYSGDSREPSIVLAILEPQPDEGNCVVVDLASATQLVEKTATPLPVEIVCLGNAVKYGYLRGIVSALMKGGQHAE